MRLILAVVTALAATFATSLVAPRAALAQPAAAGVSVTEAFALPTPGGRNVTAAYVSIANAGAAGDRLVSASSAAAERVEIHTVTRGENGAMQMRALSDGLAIPAGQTVRMAPGGLHLMLIGLRAPAAEGDRLPLRLVFERAGALDVVAAVQRPRPAASGHAHH